MRFFLVERWLNSMLVVGVNSVFGARGGGGEGEVNVSFWVEGGSLRLKVYVSAFAGYVQ